MTRSDKRNNKGTAMLCNFCGQEADWTEPVTDIDEHGNEIELRACFTCSMPDPRVLELIEQMRKRK